MTKPCTPAQTGMYPLLSSVMAMALPMTSWMSLPMMAISVITHSAYRGTRGYSLLQTDRSLGVHVCYVRALITARRQGFQDAMSQLEPLDDSVPAVLGEVLACRHAQLCSQHLHDIPLHAERRVINSCCSAPVRMSFPTCPRMINKTAFRVRRGRTMNVLHMNIHRRL